MFKYLLLASSIVLSAPASAAELSLDAGWYELDRDIAILVKPIVKDGKLVAIKTWERDYLKAGFQRGAASNDHARFFIFNEKKNWFDEYFPALDAPGFENRVYVEGKRKLALNKSNLYSLTDALSVMDIDEIVRKAYSKARWVPQPDRFDSCAMFFATPDCH